MATSTTQCPFCLGTIPAAARKCQHCGEWVDKGGAPARAPGSSATARQEDGGLVQQFFEGKTLDQTLNAGVKIWGAWRIAGAVIGLIFMIVVGGKMCSQMDEFDRSTNFGPGAPAQYCSVGGEMQPC